MRVLTACLWLSACGEASHRIVVPVTLQAQTDVSQVLSYQLWVLSQVGLDDAPIACDALLRRTLFPSDANVRSLLAPIEGDFGGSEIIVKDVQAGEQNRLFYIVLFDKPALQGQIIGIGCAQSVTIVGGRVNTVVVRVSPPPPPPID